MLQMNLLRLRLRRQFTLLGLSVLLQCNVNSADSLTKSQHRVMHSNEAEFKKRLASVYCVDKAPHHSRSIKGNIGPLSNKRDWEDMGRLNTAVFFTGPIGMKPAPKRRIFILYLSRDQYVDVRKRALPHKNTNKSRLYDMGYGRNASFVSAKITGQLFEVNENNCLPRGGNIDPIFVVRAITYEY